MQAFRSAFLTSKMDSIWKKVNGIGRANKKGLFEEIKGKSDGNAEANTNFDADMTRLSEYHHKNKFE